MSEPSGVIVMGDSFSAPNGSWVDKLRAARTYGVRKLAQTGRSARNFQISPDLNTVDQDTIIYFLGTNDRDRVEFYS